MSDRERPAGPRSGARPVPRLASDSRRTWLTAIGFVPSIALGYWLARTLHLSAGEAGAITAIMMSLAYLPTYAVLTFRTFGPLEPARLQEVTRSTNRRPGGVLEKLMATDAMSWVLTAVGLALLGVGYALVMPGLRHQWWSLVLCVALAVGAWFAIQAAAAVALMRADVDHDALRFPDGERERSFSDYRYAAQQIQSTMGTSDIVLLTPEIRSTVRTISSASMVFNTVVIALLVAALVR